MQNHDFRRLLDAFDRRNPAQIEDAQTKIRDLRRKTEAISEIEARTSMQIRCPFCRDSGRQKWGHTRTRIQRYAPGRNAHPNEIEILAVCALEWRSAIADAVVETHDRIVGKTWREAKSRCDARMDDAKSALKDTLQSFKTLGAALYEAHEDQASLEKAVGSAGGWIFLKGLVATAAQLTDTFAADPLAHVGHG